MGRSQGLGSHLALTQATAKRRPGGASTAVLCTLDYRALCVCVCGSGSVPRVNIYYFF